MYPRERKIFNDGLMKRDITEGRNSLLLILFRSKIGGAFAGSAIKAGNSALSDGYGLPDNPCFLINLVFPDKMSQQCSKKK